ncbi:MAG: carbamoyltransferase HypF [Candidatus Eisenbacteria bacterium]
MDPAGRESSSILESDDAGEKGALVLPDVATCPDCLREIFDPGDRRHLYPFTNCTNCGPRFSIIRSLPYDRSKTTMAKFTMCDRCRAEYEDPSDRRFHAQPNACPECGPRLALWNEKGRALAERRGALLGAVASVREGRIVAVKGLGGFHLVADASNDGAVRRLRERKHREEKPLAIMVSDLGAARVLAAVSPEEARLLASPEAPIVLLRAKNGGVAPSVAPGNPNLGVLLPYTPLHHILLREFGGVIVATSGNRSDEPICTEEEEALERLAGIADLFLVHDRPIERHVDDSIARVVLGREMILRRARGYAPLPVRLPADVGEALAAGAEQKSVLAVSRGREAFLSQHVGDLESVEAYDAYRRTFLSFAGLHEIRPVRVACDIHPDFASTRHAEESGLPVTRVQHHHAHVLSCTAENELEGPVLGVAWDGFGLGPDRGYWGGEFLVPEGRSFRRVASLRPYPLVGGDAAALTPSRSAGGILFATFREKWIDMFPVRPEWADARRLPLLEREYELRAERPNCTSMGRLFDAVASLAGVCRATTFEGQPAMALEWAIDGRGTDEAYPLPIVAGEDRLLLDWEPMIHAILCDVGRRESPSVVSARFHNALTRAIVETARRIGPDRVVLTGGCFQNEYLLRRGVEALRSAGFRPYWHQRVPPNDGGIALGQLAALAYHDLEGS